MTEHEDSTFQTHAQARTDARLSQEHLLRVFMAVIVLTVILQLGMTVYQTNRLNDGQEAVVCILSVPEIQDRAALRDECLDAAGL